MHAQRVVELAIAEFGDLDVDGATVTRAELAFHEARLFEAVDEARGAARGVDDRVSDLVHLQSSVGRLAKLEQHVEPGEGQFARGLEFQAETSGESSVRLE